MADETRERLREGFEHFRPQGWWREQASTLLDALDAAEAERGAARARVAELEAQRERALVAADLWVAQYHEVSESLAADLDLGSMVIGSYGAVVADNCAASLRAALSPTRDDDGSGQ